MLPNPDNSVNRSPHRTRILAAWLVLQCGGLTFVAFAAFPTADTERQFESARYREVVTGDPAGAIAEYEAILTEPGVGRPLAAGALMRIGICEETLGDGKAAYSAYMRIVSEYSDQKEIARKAAVRLAIWSGPRNLKFEEGAAGKAPPGWFVPSLPKDADYLAELHRDHCRSRSGCAVVTAPANVPRPTGNLMQSFSAAAYAGRTVRLRAWLRVEAFFFSPAFGIRLPSPEDRAELWLSVERANRRKGFYESMDDRPVRSPEWTEAEIEGEVDRDARFINFGILSIGGARVWVDDVSFDVIPK
jgi:hypothetical protein